MISFKFFNPFASKPVKPSFPSAVDIRDFNGRKYIRKMPVQAKDSIVYLESFPTNNSTLARTAVYDSYNSRNPIAFHDYDIYNMLKDFSGSFMETDINRRKQGLGELLRLASIIEMKENELTANKIFSKPEAVMFHYKYGFRPAVKDDSVSKKVLNDILGKTGDDDIKQRADNLINAICKNGYIDETQCTQTNDIITDYIKRNVQKGLMPEFGEGFDMVLTDKDIKANAGFYNRLFEKHQIDYSV